MRKQWLKKEDIYYKPFYKQKPHIYLIAILVLGIIFIMYQVYTVNQLTTQKKYDWNFDEAIQDFKRRHNEVMIKLGFREGDEKPWHEPEIDADHNLQQIKIVRGTRLYDYDAYKPNFKGKFKCLDGSKEINWIQVNDDYCDCLNDGSDEPSTNACINGRFYCTYQKRHITGRGLDTWVPSSRVNDQVCDCCDGSDEFSQYYNYCEIKCI